MARIAGPLLSLDARGNWAKGALQFRGGLQATHAYRPAPPGSVNQAAATPAQATVRAAYQAVYADWQDLTPEAQAQWNANAAPQGLSGWNLYLKTELPALLAEPQLPDPNTYVPVLAGAVLFPGTTWVSDTGYTQPPIASDLLFPED